MTFGIVRWLGLVVVLGACSDADSSGPVTSGGVGGVAQDAGGTQPDATISGSGGSGGAVMDSGSAADCEAEDLVWQTAQKTNYVSYPEPGSQECVEYNGCEWEGLFAACDGKKSEAWVEAHNIVAAFPSFGELELHDLCLRSGDETIVVTVYDTCADSDCDGCCTENQGSADQLIDLESYTNERWGVADGRIEWADLGPTRTSGCD